MAEFEVYESERGRRGVAALAYPAVGISSPNTPRLTFNAQAAEVIGLRQTHRGVVLQFSRREGLVAIRPAGENERPQTVQRVAWQKNGGGSINLVGFCKTFGIDAKKAKGDYRLGYDEKLALHLFRLPAGSWEKPEVVLGKRVT